MFDNNLHFSHLGGTKFWIDAIHPVSKKNKCLVMGDVVDRSVLMRSGRSYGNIYHFALAVEEIKKSVRLNHKYASIEEITEEDIAPAREVYKKFMGLGNFAKTWMGALHGTESTAEQVPVPEEQPSDQ